MQSEKQKEWKIRKDLELTYPNCEKGIELLCQTTLSINGVRYRDIILQLSKSNHNLAKTFLDEVTAHRVNAYDKNWKKRFQDIYLNSVGRPQSKKTNKRTGQNDEQERVESLIKKVAVKRNPVTSRKHSVKQEIEEEIIEEEIIEDDTEEDDDFIL